MEKNLPKNLSSSAKCTGSEPKNKQDACKFPRLPRCRETVSPRPEAGRRCNNPQRNRELFDKRPRHRAGPVCERYRGEIDEDDADLYTKRGHKKVNFNHLLNFTLAPHEMREGHKIAHNRSKLPKYNKELFLQANCQFVVRENGNYKVHLENPDILVEWSLIEEIHVPSYEVPQCPICLYTPVAAKITRCGHIYCWPCMLHYLALTDRSWQKCPICFDVVHKTELKSVSVQLKKLFTVGDEIPMCLMKKERVSLLTVPALHDLPPQFVCNINNDEDITRFQKLLMAGESEIDKILKRERSELRQKYLEEIDTPEACFIEEALELLEKRENCFLSEVKHGSPAKDVDCCDHSVAALHDGIASSPGNSSFDGEKRGNCYFYQAEDGQHIFLHSINVRMLLNEFNSLENTPDNIRAGIVEIERVSMNEALRNRFGYLRHLPLTCEFQIVELDFSKLLSKKTLDQFRDEIDRRRQLRNKKARYERRREKFIEQEENKKLGKYPRATYNLKSAAQFPVFDLHTDFQTPLSPSSANGTETFGIETMGIKDGPQTDECPTEDNPVTSFAQMLKAGSAKSAPVRKSATFPPSDKSQQHPVVDDDDDDWVTPPEYRQSFSDAIQAALDSVSAQNNVAPDGAQKSSKKKKCKKQLLFTTSMCRNK